MDLSPLAGIKVQIVPDYPVFKFVPMKARRKWGPKNQPVKVLSHYDCILKDGEVLTNERRRVFFMNARTKIALDKAIIRNRCYRR